jgi:hypothetical protein
MRWIDNGVVDMVSTVHTGQETIVKRRRKPRETSTNYRHITTVFGSDWEKMIAIPGCIDDYNHTMNGVDKAYQLISYYHPGIRCGKKWMPMSMHCLDICRVNSYIIAKAKGVCDSQKEYTLDWIQALNQRAYFMDLQSIILYYIILYCSVEINGSGSELPVTLLQTPNSSIPNTKMITHRFSS